MRRLALALAIFAMPAGASATTAPVIATSAVPDAALATMRGGFRLPNGIDVSLAVQTDTAVNGALLLRSVFTAAEGRPTVEVLVPEPDQAVSIAKRGAADVAGAANVSVRFDPRAGIVSTPAAPTISLGGNAAGAADAAVTPGLAVVDAASGAAAVQTPVGTVSVSDVAQGTRIRLEGAGIDVSHIVGDAIGTVIANTASDRVIDTSTTISLDLRNAGPDVLGSAMLRVEGLAVDAARLGIR